MTARRCPFAPHLRDLAGAAFTLAAILGLVATLVAYWRWSGGHP